MSTSAQLPAQLPMRSSAALQQAVGGRITALVGREVEGNVSVVERYWTGLSATEPNEPSRQDFGDFVEPFGSGHLFGRKSVAHRVTVRMIDDCPRMTKKNSKNKALAKSFAKEISCACHSEIERGG